MEIVYANIKSEATIGGAKMKKQFAVIGLGRFGGSVCRELMELGAEVLAIDFSEERVNELKDIVTHAAILDSTDEQALKSIGISNFDHVIVAIGENIQASILTTLMLTELGVKHITVKAQNDYHEKVLQKIGAHLIVHPERDMGRKIAHSILSKNVLDYLELSDKHSIMELVAGTKMHGKSLIELNVRAKYGINIIGIKRGDEVIISPVANERIYKGDILIVIGADVDIERFEKMLLDKE